MLNIGANKAQFKKRRQPGSAPSREQNAANTQKKTAQNRPVPSMSTAEFTPSIQPMNNLPPIQPITPITPMAAAPIHHAPQPITPIMPMAMSSHPHPQPQSLPPPKHVDEELDTNIISVDL